MFIGLTGVRPDRRVPDARCGRQIDAGHPAAREHRRQHPGEPLHRARHRTRRASLVGRSPRLCRRAAGRVAAVLRRGAAASPALLGGWTWFAVARSGTASWLNLVQPLAAGGLALFVGTAYRYFVEDREKRKVEAAVRPLRVDATSTRS